MANTEIKYVSPERLSYYDQKIKNYIANADKAIKDELQGNIDEVSQAVTNEATTARANEATLAADIAKAQAAADAAQSDVDALEKYVGTFTSETAKTVIEYVDVRTKDVASDEAVQAIDVRLTQAEADIDDLEADVADRYTKAEIDAKVSALESANEATQGEVDSLETVVSNNNTTLGNKITAEETAREEADSALSTRVKAIEDDYLKATDKTALQDQITTNANAIELLTNGVSADEVDGVKDLIQYVKEHGPEVTGMQEDIADNAAAIEAETTTRTEETTAIKGRLDVLEAINHDAYKTSDEALEAKLTEEINKKADSSTVSALETTLKAADSALTSRVTALEEAVGDANVADDIAQAKSEAITESKNYTNTKVGALTDVVNTKADASTVSTLSGKMTTAEGEIDQLQADVEALESASATHALASDLTALTTRVGSEETKSNNFESRIAELESVTHTEISESEIDTMFAQA